MVLYSFSTLYHSMGVFYHESQDVKQSFRKYDHIAIFCLIAGTYTPLVLILLVKRAGHIWVGYGVLTLVWLCAFLGTIMKLFFPIDMIPEFWSNALFLIQGWMIVIVFKPLIRVTPFIVLKYIGIGGIAYSGGVYFLTWEKLQFNHSIWHLHVLTGSITHFIAVILTLLDPNTLRDSESKGVLYMINKALFMHPKTE